MNVILDFLSKMPHCIIEGCKNYSKKGGASFYRLPNFNEKLGTALKWITYAKKTVREKFRALVSLKPKPLSELNRFRLTCRVCHLHFSPECFVQYGQCLKKQIYTLKPGSIPTRYLPTGIEEVTNNRNSNELGLSEIEKNEISPHSLMSFVQSSLIISEKIREFAHLWISQPKTREFGTQTDQNLIIERKYASIAVGTEYFRTNSATQTCTKEKIKLEILAQLKDTIAAVSRDHTYFSRAKIIDSNFRTCSTPKDS